MSHLLGIRLCGCCFTVLNLSPYQQSRHFRPIEAHLFLMITFVSAFWRIELILFITRPSETRLWFKKRDVSAHLHLCVPRGVMLYQGTDPRQRARAPGSARFATPAFLFRLFSAVEIGNRDLYTIIWRCTSLNASRHFSLSFVRLGQSSSSQWEERRKLRESRDGRGKPIGLVKCKTVG